MKIQGGRKDFSDKP